MKEIQVAVMVIYALLASSSAIAQPAFWDQLTRSAAEVSPQMARQKVRALLSARQAQWQQQPPVECVLADGPRYLVESALTLADMQMAEASEQRGRGRQRESLEHSFREFKVRCPGHEGDGKQFLDKVGDAIKNGMNARPHGQAVAVAEPRRDDDRSGAAAERSRAKEPAPARRQASFPPGAKLMRGIIRCGENIGEATAVHPERDGSHISLTGDSDFGPFDARDGTIQGDIFFGRVKAGERDCYASLASVFIPNGVPTGVKQARVKYDEDVLRRLGIEGDTLIRNADSSLACDSVVIKQARALLALAQDIANNVANWPQLGSWAETYIKQATELVVGSGCMSRTASLDYEGAKRRREQEFRTVVAGSWSCRATLGSRDFWAGPRNWVFQERYVESYLSLPNGNTLLVIHARPNEKILHLEPRSEARSGQRVGPVFSDMLDAELIHLNASSLRFRVVKADAGAYFPPAGGEVKCTR